MDAFAKFSDEIALLTVEAVVKMKYWPEHDPAAKYNLTIDLTTMLVFGEVSPATFAVHLLASQRFKEASAVLSDFPQTTLEERAKRSRRYESLQRESDVLRNLFRILVEREIPEASEYYAWEMHPSGQIFVRLSGEHKDKRFVSYFSGRTNPRNDL